MSPDEDTIHKQLRNSERQELAMFVGMTLLCIAGAALLWLQHPGNYLFAMPCPFAQLTGLLCPGCGSSRATHSLLQGDLLMALRYNPVMIVLLPFIAVLYVQRLLYFRYGKTFEIPYSQQLYIAIAAFVILYFVARNIPLDIFGILRPPT